MTTNTPLLEPITRIDLSESVAERLRELIVAGDLAEGERLAERDLAERLNVSRTPVREALAELQREGFVAPLGRRGLCVTTTSKRHAEELYPLIGIIEGHCLRSAPPDGATLDALDEINGDLRAEKRRQKKIALDKLWHQTLISKGENHEADRILRYLKGHSTRYENLYHRDANNIHQSVAEHFDISERLKSGKIKDAVARLKSHWIESGHWLADLVEPKES